MKRIIPSALLLVILTLPVLSHAQTPAPDTSASPLEITADNALEWDRTNKQYKARGNAVATQKDMSVTADTLVADYREGKEKKTEIYRLTATGHVVLTSGENKAYGENAVYTMDDGKAVLTGGDLKIVGKDMTITAKDRFEYYANEGRMVAIGAPVITNLDRTLTADKVTAWTAPQTNAGAGEAKKPESTSSAKSLGNLQRALAEGNVVITTPKEKATSDKATYTAQTDLVELTGNVKLNQGINQLEGERAEMNMATNVSRIFGAPGKGGRVKGVFFPGSQSK